MSTRKVIVIGAGITGLSASYYLQKESARCGDKIELLVLEAGPRPGGVICSTRSDAGLMESGPEAFITTKKEALELAFELGLANRLLETNKQHRRSLIAKHGSLHALPDGFVMFAPSHIKPLALTSLLSPVGKMRMAMDLFVPATKVDNDESVAHFVQRRLGREALECLAQPLIGAVYGGKLEHLSAAATIPQMVELERTHGSLIRGLWAGKSKTPKSSGPRYGLFLSFDEGMQVLVDALVHSLPPNTIKLGQQVHYICRSSKPMAWTVQSGNQRFDADAVVVCAPASAAANMLASTNADLSSLLGLVNYEAALVVNLIFDTTQVKSKLDAFGFVVPAKETASIRACTFSSVKFDRRASSGKILMRVFLSADAQHELMSHADSRIISCVLEDLRKYLHIEGSPLETAVIRHKVGLPQYYVGHTETVRQITQLVAGIPGLYLAGNAYKGPGIPDCIRSGKTAALAVLQHFEQLAEEGNSAL